MTTAATAEVRRGSRERKGSVCCDIPFAIHRADVRTNVRRCIAISNCL